MMEATQAQVPVFCCAQIPEYDNKRCCKLCHEGVSPGFHLKGGLKRVCCTASIELMRLVVPVPDLELDTDALT